MKAESIGPYIDLPREVKNRGVKSQFELAVTGLPEQERLALAAQGWLFSEPYDVSRDPWTYQNFIQQSKAEFTVAKHGYAISRSGWFSERSACYLASGRPVLSQDTGFSDWLETGLGIVAFDTLSAAIAGIEDINGRYELHCQAARALAAEHFDARKVLSHLIESALSNTS
jgi:hypothetical protein